MNRRWFLGSAIAAVAAQMPAPQQVFRGDRTLPGAAGFNDLDGTIRVGDVITFDTGTSGVLGGDVYFVRSMVTERRWRQ